MATEKDFIRLIISNPSNWPRTELISAHFKNSLNTHSLQIYDSKNFELTSQIELEKEDLYKIRFVAEDVPALGKKMFYIKKRDPKAEFQLPEIGLLDGNDYYIENDVIRVVIEENGTITVMDRKNEEEKQGKCEEKVTIMGEELGCGSIWADDSFYNYSNLHIVELEPKKEQNFEISYSLIEANDFRGTLKLDRKIKSEDNIQISTLISLEKGEKPLIKINTKFMNLPSKNNLKILFPCKLSVNKLEVLNETGIYRLWDPTKKRGLAFFTFSDNLKLMQNEKNETVVLMNLPNDGGSYAILPLKSPNDDEILKLGEEFRNPLNWEQD
ncbi:hypothetical protein DSAG12_00851 [Promethearchaeum syntrophicum]|uniref:Uncharacterized protein n=1 Tax=Promethearchaeum syntrophicum TaxID=2594042 RepID=A0A5B9D779_9ARCH|nr:hypothetical protein [Candidatus Prometheoarchaeum syntrophicum]QEE15028.1 alpha-mannosidase [Candidatus Prometheoarchaeum syntrophicum]